MSYRIWLRQIRAPFLILAPITYSIGVAAAYVDGYFNLLNMILGFVGVTLAHISINVLNEYFDYKNGLDFKTIKTPFSGGSNILTSGELKSETVYKFGIICLTIGSGIGIYLAYNSTWMILPIIALAILTIYFYTPIFSKLYLGELITGINFGPLVAIGGYMTLTKEFGFTSLYAGVVPGLLVGTLLFLNEFPDIDADKTVGRRNVVIAFGKKKSSIIYGVLIICTYLWVFLTVIKNFLPPTVLVTYFTLPIGYKAVKGVINNQGKVPEIIPYMGENVKLTLTMTALMAIGIILSNFI
ncbi:prenyltransferase [Candidatus Bathyarchaeota archaeon]|nr:prenyltransferase [Candidatus Bathyarchaeota archaeon]